MTKRLILTRHAKSSWDNANLADRDRPLNARGRAAAVDLGLWLASRGYVPDEVICSDATRTRETWEAIAPSLPGAPAARLTEKLYQAGPDVMLAMLRHASGDTVLMLGHNPGIAEFAQRLVLRAPLNGEFQRYPTAATLVVEFPIDNWADLAPGTGATDDFIVPKEIEA